MKIRRLVLTAAFVAVGVLAFGTDRASASPIFSCGATVAECNGLTYAVSFDGQFAAQQRYGLWIQTGASYTGNATDVINSVALSEMLSSFTGTNAALLQAPGVGPWTFSLNELNASGCAGGGTNSLCAQWNGAGFGVPVLPATIYQWQFGFDAAGAFDTQAHIKYVFATAAGKEGGLDKVGDLGSWDIDIQDCSNRQCEGGLGDPVPEPTSLLLLGTGLAFGVRRLRRRKN